MNRRQITVCKVIINFNELTIDPLVKKNVEFYFNKKKLIHIKSLFYLVFSNWKYYQLKKKIYPLRKFDQRKVTNHIGVKYREAHVMGFLENWGKGK